VLFPEKAPWLDDLLAELLAFSKGRNDDQVDSVSQLLTHVRLAPRAVLAGATARWEESARRRNQNSQTN
jgi:phage terminase large subunit-like protein